MKTLYAILAIVCAAPLAARAAEEQKAVEPGASAGPAVKSEVPAEAAAAREVVPAPAEPAAVKEEAPAEPATVKEEAPAEPATVRVDSSVPAPVAEKTPVTMDTYSHQVGRKLKRGVVNMLRSGTEFYVQPMEAKRLSGKSISMIWPGAGEAFGMFLTRLFGGIIEGATCVVPFPNGWQPILDE